MSRTCTGTILCSTDFELVSNTVSTKNILETFYLLFFSTRLIPWVIGTTVRYWSGLRNFGPYFWTIVEHGLMKLESIDLTWKQ